VRVRFGSGWVNIPSRDSASISPARNLVVRIATRIDFCVDFLNVIRQSAATDKDFHYGIPSARRSSQRSHLSLQSPPEMLMWPG
jgi:hypothetical protein